MEFEGHRTTGAKGMAADVIKAEALSGEANCSGSKLDCPVDMGTEHVVARAIDVVGGDGRCRVVARICHDVMDAVGK